MKPALAVLVILIIPLLFATLLQAEVFEAKKTGKHIAILKEETFAGKFPNKMQSLESSGIRIQSKLENTKILILDKENAEKARNQNIEVIEDFLIPTPEWLSQESNSSQTINPLMQDTVNLTGANVAQQLGFNGSGIIVAVIDSGVFNHSDLTGNILGHWQANSTFVGEDNSSQPCADHGTHVAGTIAASGSLKGVAPAAKLYDVKVGVTAQSCAIPFSVLLQGIEYAISKRANIISMSLGSYQIPNEGYHILEKAVEAAIEKNITVVIAAGNSGSGYSTLTSPGLAEKAITVGAVDKSNLITSFSARGPRADGMVKPDILTQGNSVNSTSYSGSSPTYATKSGTSMATPHVAGAAAILLQKNPSWTPKQVKEAIMFSADDLNILPQFQGAGKLNISSALNATFSLNNTYLKYKAKQGQNVVVNETIYNNGNSNLTLNLSISNFYAVYCQSKSCSDNFTLASITPSQITISSNSSASIQINITISSNFNAGTYIGSINFNNTVRPVSIVVPIANNFTIKTYNKITSPYTQESGDWMHFALDVPGNVSKMNITIYANNITYNLPGGTDFDYFILDPYKVGRCFEGTNLTISPFTCTLNTTSSTVIPGEWRISLHDYNKTNPVEIINGTVSFTFFENASATTDFLDLKMQNATHFSSNAFTVFNNQTNPNVFNISFSNITELWNDKAFNTSQIIVPSNIAIGSQSSSTIFLNVSLNGNNTPGTYLGKVRITSNQSHSEATLRISVPLTLQNNSATFSDPTSALPAMAENSGNELRYLNLLIPQNVPRIQANVTWGLGSNHIITYLFDPYDKLQLFSTNLTNSSGASNFSIRLISPAAGLWKVGIGRSSQYTSASDNYTMAMQAQYPDVNLTASFNTSGELNPVGVNVNSTFNAVLLIKNNGTVAINLTVANLTAVNCTLNEAASKAYAQQIQPGQNITFVWQVNSSIYPSCVLSYNVTFYDEFINYSNSRLSNKNVLVFAPSSTVSMQKTILNLNQTNNFTILFQGIPNTTYVLNATVFTSTTQLLKQINSTTNASGFYNTTLEFPRDFNTSNNQTGAHVLAITYASNSTFNVTSNLAINLAITNASGSTNISRGETIILTTHVRDASNQTYDFANASISALQFLANMTRISNGTFQYNFTTNFSTQLNFSIQVNASDEFNNFASNTSNVSISTARLTIQTNYTPTVPWNGILSINFSVARNSSLINTSNATLYLSNLNQNATLNSTSLAWNYSKVIQLSEVNLSLGARIVSTYQINASDEFNNTGTSQFNITILPLFERVQIPWLVNHNKTVIATLFINANQNISGDFSTIIFNATNITSPIYSNTFTMAPNAGNVSFSFPVYQSNYSPYNITVNLNYSNGTIIRNYTPATTFLLNEANISIFASNTSLCQGTSYNIIFNGTAKFANGTAITNQDANISTSVTQYLVALDSNGFYNTSIQINGSTQTVAVYINNTTLSNSVSITASDCTPVTATSVGSSGSQSSFSSIAAVPSTIPSTPKVVQKVSEQNATPVVKVEQTKKSHEFVENATISNKVIQIQISRDFHISNVTKIIITVQPLEKVDDILTIKEEIPTAIAENLDDITFSPRPFSIIGRTVIWKADNIEANEKLTFTYTIKTALSPETIDLLPKTKVELIPNEIQKSVNQVEANLEVEFAPNDPLVPKILSIALIIVALIVASYVIVEVFLKPQKPSS